MVRPAGSSQHGTNATVPYFHHRQSNIFGQHTYHKVRWFSNEDFKSTLNKMKDGFQEQKDKANTSTENGTEDGTTKADASSSGSGADPTKEGFQFSLPKLDVRSIINWGYDTAESMRDSIELAYKEMTASDPAESRLKTTVHQAESFRRTSKPSRKDNDDDDDDEDSEKDSEADTDPGPSAIVLVKEPKGAWEQMKERLQDSPFIKEILKNSRKVGKAAADTDIGRKAQDMGKSVQDKIEDAREVWETSQNPLVYTVAGVWENITGETEEAIAISEIRKLDPGFSKEEWAAEVKEKLAPVILKSHLIGDTKALKPWLGEAVYNKLAADIRARKHDGISFDPNILDIEENQIIMKFLENGGPVIVVVYMVQQINCIRNRKGEITEGSENDIRAKFYSMAFQQNYDEDDSTVEWKVVDYEFAGDIPYF